MRALRDFLPPRIVARIQAHRLTYGRLPGPGCECAECLLPFEPPQCATCGDAGFVRLPVPYGHAQWAKAQPCPHCGSETIAERTERLRNASGIPWQLWEWCTFERLDAGTSPRREAETYTAGGKWLVLEGNRGTGKTHAAIAICRREIEAGRPAIFWRTVDLFTELRRAFGGGSDPERATRQERVERLRRRVMGPAVVVFDDLAAERTTAWSEEELYAVLGWRYDQRYPTVITTNISATRPPESRVWSRIFAGRNDVVTLTGPDRRKG